MSDMLKVYEKAFMESLSGHDSVALDRLEAQNHLDGLMAVYRAGERAALERAAGLVKAKREHWNEEAASYGERREWDATNAAESKEAAAGECESAIRRELEASRG